MTYGTGRSSSHVGRNLPHLDFLHLPFPVVFLCYTFDILFLSVLLLMVYRRYLKCRVKSDISRDFATWFGVQIPPRPLQANPEPFVKAPVTLYHERARSYLCSKSRTCVEPDRSVECISALTQFTAEPLQSGYAQRSRVFFKKITRSKMLEGSKCFMVDSGSALSI